MALHVARPFPIWLRWTLLGPISVDLLVNVLALGGTDPFLKGLWIAAFCAAAIVAVVAVPYAIFLILRRGYFTIWNLLMTVVAALPLAFAIVLVVTLKYGHFHI